MRPLPSLALAGLLVSGLAGCGTSRDAAPNGPAGSVCGPVVREPLDASTSLHLLPGAPEPTYLSDPPTSGPHRSGSPPVGALDAAIDRPTQVLVLETGGVLIQHRDLTGDEAARLSGLAGGQVVVAPNPGLATPVVATAWLTRQTCQGVDVDALGAFVEDHVGRGPDAGEAGAG